MPRYRRPPRVEEPQAFSWDPVMVLVCILFIVASLLFCSIPLGRDADADADRNSQGPVCQCGPVLCTSNRTQPGCAPPAYDLTCSAEAPRRHVWHPASARFNGTMASALRASGFDPEQQRLVIIVGVGHSGTSTVACELSGASDLARTSREGGSGSGSGSGSPLVGSGGTPLAGSGSGSPLVGSGSGSPLVGSGGSPLVGSGGKPEPEQLLGDPSPVKSSQVDPKLALPKLRRPSKPFTAIVAHKRKSLGRQKAQVRGYLGTACMQVLLTAPSPPHRRCAGT